MKNFDDGRKHNHTPAEDRTFVLGGETFVAKEDIHPSILTAFDRLEDANVTETLKVIDETIVAMIEADGDAHVRYAKVRANVDEPITLGVMTDLARWLVEVQSARPTGQPSGSGPGRSTTETPSTDGSSSRVKLAASAA